MDTPRQVPQEYFKIPWADTPRGRGLTPEQTRAESLAMLRLIRDEAPEPSDRDAAAGILRRLGGDPDVST